MPFALQTSLALPTRDELLTLLPAWLAASDELVARDPAAPLFVYAHLSPAWSNVDFDPRLDAFSALDRAFVERQIERSHRDDQLGRSWSLSFLDGVPLAEPSLFDDETTPWEVLLLEVPVVSVDRNHAVLRGQRQTSAYAEDFEHHLTREHGAWTRRR
ncbi:MAG: hypothetical protein KC586_02255 [Myxococcales bacterium]|nr:hypothetical protein [Myxococcales bacterium]